MNITHSLALAFLICVLCFAYGCEVKTKGTLETGVGVYKYKE
ncbi:MAG: hypothetical protein DELT_00413 [Desulfovibrio sp.]